MTKRTSRRTSKRTSKRTSRAKVWRRSSAPAWALFMVDTRANQSGGETRVQSTDHHTLGSAMAKAKTAGRHDIPAVVWKHKVHGMYRPYAVVVEGKVAKF